MVPQPGNDRPVWPTAPRHHGWTIWFGRHTGQYWAAHTGTMRMVCATSPEELLRATTAATGPSTTTHHRSFQNTL